MFKKTGPNAASSSLGFSVSLVGRSRIVYTEGDKTLNVSAEMLVGDVDFIIYAETVRRWEPPFDSEVISADEMKRIMDNIGAAFDFMGITYELG
jgi:hypothetical protein